MIKNLLIGLGPTHLNASRERELVSASSLSVGWCGEAPVPPAQEGSPPILTCSQGRSCLLLSSEETLVVALLLDMTGVPRRQGN